MKFDNLALFEKALSENKALAPLYLIFAKDEFSNHESVQKIISHLLPLTSKELALTVFDGLQLNEEKLWDTLYTPSFLTSKQVVWIKQFDRAKKSVQDKIADYALKCSSSHYLILSSASYSKNTLYKTIEESGIIVEIKELKEWEKEKHLSDWVAKQCYQEGKTIKPQVCQALVKQIGTQQEVVASELEKLLCFCLSEKEITLEHVKQICAHNCTETIWKLGEALFHRDCRTSLEIAYSFLEKGQALLPLLRQLRSQYQTGYQVSLLLANKQPLSEITQQFPYMKGTILDRQIKWTQKYGEKSFLSGLLTIDAMETRLKNSGLEEKFLLELLMIQLTL